MNFVAPIRFQVMAGAQDQNAINSYNIELIESSNNLIMMI